MILIGLRLNCCYLLTGSRYKFAATGWYWHYLKIMVGSEGRFQIKTEKYRKGYVKKRTEGNTFAEGRICKSNAITSPEKD
jgi:hypothetical protein